MSKKPIQRRSQPMSAHASRIYSRENVSRYSERARQRKRSRRLRRIAVCTMLLVLLVGVGSAAAMVYKSYIEDKLHGSSITSELLATLVDSEVTKEPFYMLLLGTDGRAGEESFRSDTIIVARIDPTEQQVTLISIPRDTKVEVDGTTMKINATHYYSGADGVVQAVNGLLWPGQEGKIAHYAEVSFDGLKDLVDAIGGVEVTVPDRIDDSKAGDMVIEAGTQVLNGAQALTFCRSRAFADGDYTRMRHQRIFVAALAKQILNNTNAGNVLQLIESLSNMIETDMSVEEIASLANAMRGMNTDEIWSANLPSWAGADTYIDGVSYVFPNTTAIAAMMERVDAGLDPQASQTMSTGGSSESSTIGDLQNNTAEAYSNGTATASGNPEEEESSEESTSE